MSSKTVSAHFSATHTAATAVWTGLIGLAVAMGIGRFAFTPLLPLMQHKDVVLGLGDGGAHYAAICDASYSTFLLTYWTRDRAGEKIDWASAVRALTFTPADTMCLSDRGLLKPGYKADVNVIDAERLALHRPEVKFDLPTGGRRLDQAATGYDWTICSGEVIRQNDRSTGARPGRLVRGSQQPPMAA